MSEWDIWHWGCWDIPQCWGQGWGVPPQKQVMWEIPTEKQKKWDIPHYWGIDGTSHRHGMGDPMGENDCVGGPNRWSQKVGHPTRLWESLGTSHWTNRTRGMPHKDKGNMGGPTQIIACVGGPTGMNEAMGCPIQLMNLDNSQPVVVLFRGKNMYWCLSSSNWYIFNNTIMSRKLQTSIVNLALLTNEISEVVSPASSLSFPWRKNNVALALLSEVHSISQSTNFFLSQ